ncbi:hypothetical protein [Pedobacter miscanthi]|uniref:Uncharacterized protein n=1 Tax=Pedobacter miscanthi TaxID=2259170 RepID=A0A366KVF3_9SPHI|nr:hypothetical protein [Pedobacter miscanthi]RBQ05528.1 hypothetical protein DRW42_16225 [Pedobacter miscanthi]
MSNNQNLGYYDMVLSLSQNKINHEFKTLYRSEEISSEFKILTDLSGTENISHHSPDFDEKKADWLKLEKLAVELNSLTETVNKLANELTNAIEDENYEEVARLNKLLKPKKTDKTALEQKLSKLQQFQVMIDANISTPKVEIIEKENFSLLFKLTFSIGNLYYLEKGKLNKTGLKDKVYAFNVPIGKIKITADEMVLAGNKDEILRKSGFSDEDFTIESIFLNFNNANISDFDESKSELPGDQKDKTFLQLAITNYFKQLGHASNPYILGYAIQKRKVTTTERAMLYPTGASFSTSKSSVPGVSSFNFLMLTDNKAFPATGNSGILKNNLIEKAADKTPTINGTIAINYTAFKDIYLQQLNQAVMDNFHANFKEKHAQAYDGTQKHNGFNRFNFTRHGLRMGFDIADPKISTKTNSDGSTALVLKYRITVEGNTHKEIDKKVMIWVKAGTVGVDQPFSTSGRYEIDGQTGRIGELTLTLKASDKGKIEVVADYINPQVGKDTEDVVYKDDVDKYWDKLSDFVNPFGAIIGLYTLFTDKGRQIVEFDQSTFKSVNFNSLDTFSGRVILPGSNTYVFKNIRLMNGTESEEDAVLFDIAYSPINS